MESQQSPSWLALDPNERIEWQGSPRIQVVAGGMFGGVICALGAVGLVLAGAPLPYAGGLALAGIAVPVYVALWRRTTTYVVTTAGIYRRRGILARDVAAADLDAIQDVAFQQSATGRLFEHGSVTVRTAGGGGADVTFRYVDDPDSVARTIESVLERRGHGSTSIPGTLDQWTAIRDEVRAIRVALDGER